MRTVIAVAAGGGIIAAALIAMFASFVPTRDYSLDVDALKDEQSLFTNARVVLTNNGRLPLTNVVVDYGDREEKVDMMQPGQKMSFSPPEGTRLDFVTVTADNGISIVKEYRAPIKLPGMIGS
jgi:hypothetical protein